MSTASAVRKSVRARITEADGLVFKGYKSSAVVLQHAKPKPPRVEFEELFGKRQRQTTGEAVLILREWMRQNGLPEISEHFRVCEFASVFERFVKPRCHWRHFYRHEEHEARRFLEQWASALLPHLMH